MDNTELSKLQQLLKHKKSKKYYCEKLQITEEYLEELLQELRKEETHESLEDLENLEKTTEINNDKGTLKSTLVLTYEPKDDLELAKLHKIDLNKYKISNYWSKVRSNGKFTSSVLASLKKPVDYNPEDFAKFLNKWEPAKFYREVRSFPDTSLKELVDVELNIADFHFAKKTIQKETPEKKTFDYVRTVSDLIGKINNSYTINKLVFPISNDFFHSDNYQNTTTNGTPQDVTMWYDEEYERGFDILATSIMFLSTQAREVEVILVQGNHDVTKGFYVAHALEIFFKENKNIKFQREHSRIKHTVLGNTFIGYHHGNHCKLDQLPILFATTPSMALDFGKAKYREIHTGDKHHYLAKEITGSGVKIQQMPSLSGHDRWHVENGFVNQVRAALALVYHPEQGKIAEFEHRI